MTDLTTFLSPEQREALAQLSRDMAEAFPTAMTVEEGRALVREAIEDSKYILAMFPTFKPFRATLPGGKQADGVMLKWQRWPMVWRFSQ